MNRDALEQGIVKYPISSSNAKMQAFMLSNSLCVACFNRAFLKRSLCLFECSLMAQSFEPLDKRPDHKLGSRFTELVTSNPGFCSEYRCFAPCGSRRNEIPQQLYIHYRIRKHRLCRLPCFYGKRVLDPDFR
jgi:hypothetical protein